MSLSPQQIFGRLQELKKWQQTHEKLLQRSVNEESHQNFEKNHTNDTENYIYPSLDKDFEELLEEKLNEYNENDVETNPSVPKRPFLKKGTGLLKYNLKPEQYKNLIGNKHSNTVLPRKSTSIETKKKTVQFQTERPKTTGGVPKSVPSKRTQNGVKSNKTSVVTQRPKTAGADCSKRYDTQNRLKNKTGNNSQKIHGRDTKDHKVNDTKCHSEGPDCKNKEATNTNNPKCHSVGGNGQTIDSKPVRSPLKNDKFESTKKPNLGLHEFLTGVINRPAEYTPLKVPEMGIKTRGNWCDVPSNDFQNVILKNTNCDILQKTDNLFTNDSYANNNECAHVLVRSHWKNALETFGDSFRQTKRVPPARKSLSYTSNDNSLYEKAVETELKIFEALERRTEQSGFCSTNTSIIQLLASTPSKFNLRNTETNTDMVSTKKGNDEEDGEMHVERNWNENEYLENSEDSPISKWHSPDDPEVDEYKTEEEIDKTLEKDDNSDKYIRDHIQERKDSSTNTDNILILPSSSSSDISSDYSAETSKDYRSPMPPKNLDSSESCASCGFLIKNKIEECQSELENLKIEKDRILAIREQMDNDRREFEKEIKLRRIQFEEQKLKYELEIEEERRKMTEKRDSLERPSKEAKSKAQHRKEKEELNNLRMELGETKELMKLKDTKNAMSIARLRNQVKMLEKSNSELKAENEKLMKEKSKLVAQQKSLNKSTETKMLKEISKNISKLTEETFKNQTFKMESSSDDLCRKKLGNVGPKGDSSRDNLRTNSTQGILKNTPQQKQSKEVFIEDYAGRNQNLVEDAVEERYKSLFGGNDVVIEENRKNSNVSFGSTTKPVRLEKTERILEDGTKEIKYSNGNMKMISENGTMRYYYSSNDTWHTNFPDGSEVIEFPNGQSEKRFKDGKCVIFFPDGLIQTIFPDGTEEVKYPDGSKLLTKKDGDRLLFLTNGQVEIHTKDQKRREYPDGTVKILYPDGTQETRYSNGRVRIKNSEGQIILDTGENNL